MSDMLVYGTLGATEYSLVNLVRNYPVLYNPQDPGHHDRGRIDATWAEIGRQLNKEKEWCFTKWQSLLDDYKKRKAIYDSMGGSVTMMSWLQYDALSFLDLYQNNPHRDNTTTINQTHVATEICYTNGIPGHQQQPHHPPQQMMITIPNNQVTLSNQTTEIFLQPRTIFKCQTCPRTFAAEDKLREHQRTKQCLKFSQNNATPTQEGNATGENTAATGGKKKGKQENGPLEKYADENISMLPSQATASTTNNSSDLQQADNNSSSGSSRKGSKNSTRVTCNGCGRSFQGKNSKYALKKHYQSHYHDGPSSWGFTCNICGKKCQFQFKLDEHMRTHSKEQPFECDQCGRKFSIKFNLKRHIKLIHKIETPYLKSQNMKNA